ncbi:MAG: LysR family transcriptional regulator [Bacteriovoracaceae bacterium]
MMASPQELKYFIELSSTLNFSRAAERLGVTQPTLSLSIKNLENHLGLALFIRNKNGVTLTKAGQRFVQGARELLQNWDSLVREVNKEQNEISGRYVLGCHSAVAQYSLPNILPELLQKNPGLEITLKHDLSRKITEQVISFEIDFGIVINPVKHPDLVVIPLGKDEVTFFEKQGNKNSDILICDPDLVQTQKLSKEFKRFKRVITSSSLEVIQSLTEAGAGVGILPKRVALNSKSLKLKNALPGAPIFADQLALVFRVENKKTLTAIAIIDAIKKNFS